MNNTNLTSEAKAWVKRRAGTDEIVRVVPDMENGMLSYRLYIAYGARYDNLPDDKNPDCTQTSAPEIFESIR